MKSRMSASSRAFSRSDSWLRGPRSRTASPWTAAHVGYSMFGRREGSSRPAWTRLSRAACRCSNGPGSSVPVLGGWSVNTNAVSKRPGSVRANSRYEAPTARSRSRAPVGVCGPACICLMRSPMRLARTLTASSRTAARSASRSAKCRYAALGTTPTMRVISRSTTASGPPDRARSKPASTSAARTPLGGRCLRRMGGSLAWERLAALRFAGTSKL